MCGGLRVQGTKCPEPSGGHDRQEPFFMGVVMRFFTGCRDAFLHLSMSRVALAKLDSASS